MIFQNKDQVSVLTGDLMTGSVLILSWGMTMVFMMRRGSEVENNWFWWLMAISILSVLSLWLLMNNKRNKMEQLMVENDLLTVQKRNFWGFGSWRPITVIDLAKVTVIKGDQGSMVLSYFDNGGVLMPVMKSYFVLCFRGDGWWDIHKRPIHHQSKPVWMEALRYIRENYPIKVEVLDR